MTNTDSPYAAPAASLATATKETIVFSWSNLNGWRKAYLILSWVVVGMMTLALVSAAMLPSPEPAGSNSLLKLFIAITMLAFTAWTHIAIVRRNIGQLTTLTILNLIPLFNPIACLLMLWIRRVSVKEREQFGESKAA
jgi:hypothetical protein